MIDKEKDNYSVNFLVNRANYYFLKDETLKMIARWCKEILQERKKESANEKTNND